MIRLIQRRLIIPRGDTGTFTIPVVASKNTGDVAVFTIFSEMTKKKIYEKIVAIDSDTITVEFAHGDTVNLPVGKYVWDIKFYKNPVFLDDVLVNGDEIDSYYAAFTLPVCEIRQTGDTLLTAADAPTATIAPEYLNIVNAAISEALYNKNLAVESAAAAETSAANASTYLADTLAAKEVAEARVNEIENLSVEVSTGEEGTGASATYTPSTGVLSFEIPRGDTGNGIASCVLNADFTLTINYTDGTSLTTVPIRGDTPHLTIGEVTEGPNAIATITGTDANPVLNLTLPNANVPTRVSQLQNDAGYLTEHQDLSDYVQKTDYATDINAGLIRVNANYGLTNISKQDVITGESVIYTAVMEATAANIKEGTDRYRIISSRRAPNATFYGLAKAAGDTTQSQSSNAIGVYTDEAKAAIQQMLDVPSNSDIPTQVSELTNDAGYLTTETDPTVPAWAKAAQKPSYTAAEVGAPTVAEMQQAIVNVNTMKIHICTAAEYNAGTGVPTIESPDTQTFYLVPGGEGNNLFIEWAYVNGAWERFGSADVDLSNYVQKTDYATANDAGVLKVDKNFGLEVVTSGSNAGKLAISMASDAQVKNSVGPQNALPASKIKMATFYGLATAAGDSTQSASSNAVGTYTDEAKAAIQQMLDVPAKADIPEVPIQDVQVNGTSILENGVANIPAGGNGVMGVYKLGVNTNGLEIVNEQLRIIGANDAQIRDPASNVLRPIIPAQQHKSAFYGLAKAAGDTTQSTSSNAVGQYTDEAKAAIRTMIGVPALEDIPDVPVQDVQVNGTSVVGNDGVASIPIATNEAYGVVKGDFTYGVVVNAGGRLATRAATDAAVKAGINYYLPLTASTQHQTVFYGLSKVAGVDLANETVTLGTYPEASKIAIKAMLGVEEGLKVVRLI